MTAIQWYGLVLVALGSFGIGYIRGVMVTIEKYTHWREEPEVPRVKLRRVK